MKRRWYQKLDVVAPFRIKPKRKKRKYSTSHMNKGVDYDTRFSELPGRRIAWELERELIGEVSETLGPWETHLDFAGGTGRIAQLLEDCCDRQFVLDVSRQMLDVAEKRLKKATLLCQDFREGTSRVGDRSVDIATAFRFFPNAEPSLREAAVTYIARKLAPGGLLLCNNHRSFWSVPYIAQRMVLYRGGSAGMTNSEMKNMAERHGFEFVRGWSMGVIPQTERLAILPWRLVATCEKALFQRFGSWHSWGYNQILLFRRQ